jgi:8-oxo-(d)GTP phosphatase
MNSLYTIYVENNKLIITTDATIAPDNAIIVQGKYDSKVLLEQVSKFKKDAYIICNKLYEGIEGFKRQLPKILAGGGLVTNALGELMFIYRRGKWDLPKGKLDKGETISQCAVREVMEETGLQEVQLQDFFAHSFHIYKHIKKWYFKQTDWYLMQTQNTETNPQAEEGIEKIVWLAKGNFAEIINNTYKNIEDLLEKFEK